MDVLGACPETLCLAANANYEAQNPAYENNAAICQYGEESAFGVRRRGSGPSGAMDGGRRAHMDVLGACPEPLCLAANANYEAQNSAYENNAAICQYGKEPAFGVRRRGSGPSGVMADKLLLHFRHSRPPWRSDTLALHQ